MERINAPGFSGEDEEGRFQVPRPRGTWDRGIEFNLLRKRLFRLYRKLRERADSPKYRKRLALCMVLILQLRNGCRVSEAVEGLKKMAQAGERRAVVRVRKSKDDRLRIIVLPKFIGDHDLRTLRDEIAGITEDQVKSFARYNLGLNTHTLRYAFITHLAIEKGVQPNVIAKITGHKNLDHLITYTQKVKAEEILEREVDW
ncbi:MAG: tyrosine-type recombinase/integrase [Candidatus Korarchaeum sp.]